jgi:hypothetical protein
MMRTMFWTIARAISCVGLALGQEPSQPSASAGSNEPGVHLAPGVYRVTLRATEGPKSGHQVSGLLHLKKSTCEDRSEQTGERVEDCQYLCMWPIYGWTDVDLRAVGAAVPNSGSSAPAPSSRDPLHPGVLEVLGDCDEPEKPKIHLLAIGTVLNRRDPYAANDGPGIVVRVLRSRSNCLDGEWSEGGRSSDASGSFRACPIGRGAG